MLALDHQDKSSPIQCQLCGQNWQTQAVLDDQVELTCTPTAEPHPFPIQNMRRRGPQTLWCCRTAVPCVQQAGL